MDEFDGKLTVTGKTALNDEVVLLTLRSPDSGPLARWSPGAHIDLVLGPGLVRPYSLCGDVDDPHAYRVAVLRARDSRGGSRHVHDELAVGDAVGVRGPRNHFAFLPAARYRFIAGGIGITPLLPMIAAAEAAGADWRLLYGGRSRASMAFTDDLAAHGPKVTIRPEDETGLLDLDSVLGEPAPDTLVYACGPEGLLAAVEAGSRHWPVGTLHSERFAPRSGQPRENTENTDNTENTAFDVVLKASGVTLTVPPDRSVLNVLEDAGIPVMSSCAEGTCGTCEVPVLQGRPEHRDSVLSEDERLGGQVMMICVSRTRDERLVLDL
ncbi:PDR/VanB family oxidoreductase [Streptomyces sp. NPDC052109]|uniref:PDR/VanB family oxidoreductase n=1 Tax=Streptomyces sp. NPDC052109 TaxID=3155527 RepID=UPI0034285314